MKSICTSDIRTSVLGIMAKWDEFIEDELLQKGLLSGLSLITPQCQCVYSYKTLADLDQDNWKQFPMAFKFSTDAQDTELCSRGFSLELKDKTKKHYKVYKKTHCSAYAISNVDQEGLIACNLPIGILVCTYCYPHTASEVITVVEQFCDKLRT